MAGTPTSTRCPCLGRAEPVDEFALDRDRAVVQPDGSQIVFESDRSGVQQIYVMPAGGGEGTRISGGEGRYGTPVWSPRGDYIAFTKQNAGRFHIGVMRTDGSEKSAC